jgi:hypothetical protein
VLWGIGVWMVTVATVVAASAVASAEEPVSRDAYVDRLERVCKPRAEATRKAMDGVRQDIRYRDRLPIAADKFAKGAKIFGGTIKTIAQVPRPAADVSRLEEWFVFLNRQEDYLREITAQLRMGHTIKAQRLTSRFIQNGKQANNVTLAFEFDYCSFKFSRYGF